MTEQERESRFNLWWHQLVTTHRQIEERIGSRVLWPRDKLVFPGEDGVMRAGYLEPPGYLTPTAFFQLPGDDQPRLYTPAGHDQVFLGNHRYLTPDEASAQLRDPSPLQPPSADGGRLGTFSRVSTIVRMGLPALHGCFGPEGINMLVENARRPNGGGYGPVIALKVRFGQRKEAGLVNLRPGLYGVIAETEGGKTTLLQTLMSEPIYLLDGFSPPDTEPIPVIPFGEATEDAIDQLDPGRLLTEMAVSLSLRRVALIDSLT